MGALIVAIHRVQRRDTKESFQHLPNGVVLTGEVVIGAIYTTAIELKAVTIKLELRMLTHEYLHTHRRLNVFDDLGVYWWHMAVLEQFRVQLRHQVLQDILSGHQYAGIYQQNNSWIKDLVGVLKGGWIENGLRSRTGCFEIVTSPDSKTWWSASWSPCSPISPWRQYVPQSIFDRLGLAWHVNATWSHHELSGGRQPAGMKRFHYPKDFLMFGSISISNQSPLTTFAMFRPQKM